MRFWSETILKEPVSARHLPAILQNLRPVGIHLWYFDWILTNLSINYMIEGLITRLFAWKLCGIKGFALFPILGFVSDPRLNLNRYYFLLGR